MIDLHLHRINNLKPGAEELIEKYRELYIALDNELVKLGDDQVGHRQLAIARTNLESSLMYCSKTIALQFEKR